MRIGVDAGVTAGNRTAAYVHVETPHEDLLALCELAAQLCEAPGAAIDLIDAGQLHNVALYGVGPEEAGADGGLCLATLAADQDVYLEAVDKDPRFASAHAADARLGRGHMYAAAVLRDPSNTPVGTLSVFDPRPDRPAERRSNTVERRRRMLATLAHQVVELFELSLRTDDLARTNIELARSQRHLEAFAAQVSHDLKAPLTATLAWADLTAGLPVVAGDADASHHLRQCITSGRRMLTMIDGLLAYAGLGGTLAKRSVPLDEVMSEVLQDLGELAARGTVGWSGVAIPADPVQLRAVLQNLVANALIYTREGIGPQIEVTGRDVGGAVELTVADNGSGIPPQYRDEVLRPLMRHRTDVPGTGLGLATCQRILEGHGGTLRITDRPGGGAAVIATFPR